MNGLVWFWVFANLIDSVLTIASVVVFLLWVGGRATIKKVRGDDDG